MFCKKYCKNKNDHYSPENKKQNLWEKIFSHLHATVGLGVLNVDTVSCEEVLYGAPE
jgi:hypothetical protein